MRCGCSHVVRFLIRLMLCSTEWSLFLCMSSTSTTRTAPHHMTQPPLRTWTVAEDQIPVSNNECLYCRQCEKEIIKSSFSCFYTASRRFWTLLLISGLQKLGNEIGHASVSQTLFETFLFY